MNKEIRVIVAGSRSFNDYEFLKKKLDLALAHLNDDDREIIIFSGTARGADKLGERYAEERGYLLERYPADWKRYGKSAGPIRNIQMAQKADYLIAFWDGHSRGTQHMIRQAKAHNVDTTIYQTDKRNMQQRKTYKELPGFRSEE